MCKDNIEFNAEEEAKMDEMKVGELNDSSVGKMFVHNVNLQPNLDRLV